MMISSRQHDYVKHLVKLRTQKAYRHEQNKLLIVGEKMVAELPYEPIQMIYEDENSRNGVVVTRSVMQKITGLENPEPIAAEVSMPPAGNLRGKNRVLALNQINDPGNLGTLIRTALALGWQGVFLIGDSCDPYNEKALRAAKGATLKIPIIEGSFEELLELAKANEWTILSADMNGGTPPASKKTVLILGNESHGVSPEIKNASQSISIPMKGNMESLNVSIAGGILMYLLNQE